MYRYGRSSNQAGFRSSTPLTNDEIARYAPSVLASDAHESRGDRYAFIPTIHVLDRLRREGFQPFEVRQTNCRDDGKRAFTKHMVRLRHPDAPATAGEAPEVILINSHDGTSSYQLLSGFFRFVCSNGLIAGDVCEDIRVRHSGNVVDDVLEGCIKVVDNLTHAQDRIDLYRGVTLSDPERYLLAESAAELRWGRDDKGDLAMPIHSVQHLLTPHRSADARNDLWSTFNVVQENLVKGGLPGRSANGRRTRTREVGGVTQNVALNRALWTLADGMAKLKTGGFEPAHA